MATRRAKKTVAVRHVPRGDRIRPGIRRPGARTVTTTASARRKAEQLVTKVDRLRDRITASFYQMGVALRQLSRPAMYQALGYDSFAHLLEDREITNRMTATKLIAVVDAFEEQVALRLGMEKSYAFLRYVKTTQPRHEAGRLATTNPVIRGAGARLEEVSVRDLRRITKLRGPALASGAPALRRVETAARKLRRALRARGVDLVTASAERRGGRRVVRLELELDEAEALLVVVGG